MPVAAAATAMLCTLIIFPITPPVEFAAAIRIGFSPSSRAAVTCKVAGEIAIYILNQKRGELTRIETEHGMTINFVPTEGLAAGNFELERTKQRDPSERPRSHAVSIEAGFVRVHQHGCSPQLCTIDATNER